jgi:hypothetical protein
VSAPSIGLTARPSIDATRATETTRFPDRLPVFVVAALTVVISLLTVSPWPVGIFEDDAMYAILGKALADGQGYRFLNLPGTPYATHYPPGYPAFLAMFWKLFPGFPDNAVVFKFANVGLAGLGAIGAYYLARRRMRFGQLGASFATLLAMTTIPMLLITGSVLSEPLFIALLCPTLIVCELTAETGSDRDAVLAGLLCALLALVRTLGAVAIPATALVLVLQKRWRPAIILVTIGFLALLPWQLWASAHDGGIPAELMGKYGSYSAWLVKGYREGGMPFALGVVKRNLADFAGVLTFTLMPTKPWWPRLSTLFVILIVAVIGAPRLIRRSPVTAAFCACDLGVVCLWPVEPFRFVLAIAPVVAIWLGLGFGAALEWSHGPKLATRSAGFVLVAAGLALIGGFGAYNWKGVKGHWWESSQRDVAVRAKPVAEWVERHTAPTDVLSIDHELLIYLYTGRQAVPYLPFTAEERLKPLEKPFLESSLRNILATYKIKYVITGSAPGLKAARAIESSNPPGLRLVGAATTALVFEPTHSR